VFVVLVLAAVIASTCVLADSSEVEADTESEFPAGKPRKGKALKSARVPNERRFGFRQKVVIVPKGDPRAQAPYVAPPAPKHPKEARVIVEADVVTPPPVFTAGVPTPSFSGRVLKAGAPAKNEGACLANYRGAVAAQKAAAYQANYKSRGVKYNQSLRQFGITAKYSDCSSFVTSILADIGMDCLFAAGRYTGYMNPRIKARGGYKQTAVAGDIVMWGDHTGMITSVCGGGKYTMVAMGLSGAGLAQCKTVAQLKSWGSGGWLGFWTPRA